MKKKKIPQEIIEILKELETYQTRQLMKVAKVSIPNITQDDILQPNDYPSLENNPLFRYEEGVLHGIKSTISAISAKLKENS